MAAPPVAPGFLPGPSLHSAAASENSQPGRSRHLLQALGHQTSCPTRNKHQTLRFTVRPGKLRLGDAPFSGGPSHHCRTSLLPPAGRQFWAAPRRGLSLPIQQSRSCGEAVFLQRAPFLQGLAVQLAEQSSALGKPASRTGETAAGFLHSATAEGTHLRPGRFTGDDFPNEDGCALYHLGFTH